MAKNSGEQNMRKLIVARQVRWYHNLGSDDTLDSAGSKVVRKGPSENGTKGGRSFYVKGFEGDHGTKEGQGESIRWQEKVELRKRRLPIKE